MKNLPAVAALLMIATPAICQPPPGMFAGVPNVGRVWITVCAAQHTGCHKVEPQAWGQLCDPGGAQFAAETWVRQNPLQAKAFHPVRWECQEKMDTKMAPWPMSGPLPSPNVVGQSIRVDQ